MIKLTIIDNFNKEHQKFEKRFRDSLQLVDIPFQWDWIHYSRLNKPEIKSYIHQSDGIILSGSYKMVSEPDTTQIYNEVIQLIKNFEKPILGICFGHQLIGKVFGATIQRLEDSDYNIENEKAMELQFDGQFPLVKTRSIWVYQTHHQEIRFSKNFVSKFHIHASSPSCRIQAISHKNRDLFGVQFHPENPHHSQAAKDGQKLLKNFVSFIDQKKS